MRAKLLVAPVEGRAWASHAWQIASEARPAASSQPATLQDRALSLLERGKQLVGQFCAGSLFAADR
jgi:hypothetical protein